MSQNSFVSLPIIDVIKSYLETDNMRYQQISEEALEMYMQGNNLTMHLVIYVHNSHLIFRVPNFIRNVELRRLEILLFINQVTNEILDIRFEISKDEKSLSACCQHILEDGTMTRKQFDLAIMVLMHIVDDTYPRFMQLIYGKSGQPEQAGHSHAGVEVNGIASAEAADENEAADVEDSDEFAPVADDEEIPRKIN